MRKARKIERAGEGIYALAGYGDAYARNTERVLALLIEQPGLRSKEIEGRLNLSKSAVLGAVAALRKMGFVAPPTGAIPWSKPFDGPPPATPGPAVTLSPS